jgi:hypothetical protein
LVYTLEEDVIAEGRVDSILWEIERGGDGGPGG